MKPNAHDVAQRFDNLEMRVQEVISWGRILRLIATSREPVDRTDIQVLGDALDTLGGRMNDDLNDIQVARGRGL